MKRRSLILPAAGIIAAMMLNSCFTGIESTPRITQKEVVRQNATTTDEEAFASSLDIESLDRWKPGKRFLVSDSRAALLMSSDHRIEAGDTLVFRSMIEVPAVTGDSATIITFNLPSRYGDERLDYRLDFPLSELMSRARFVMPFTVDLDLVAEAGVRFIGKHYYIVTPLWNDGHGNTVKGDKFVGVTITDVIPGNDKYPLNVLFTTDTGRDGAVMMTVGGERSATRNFGEVFSFDDPRQRYQSISDEVWARIVKSDVMAGMTRDECRLALGAPRDVKKGENGTVYFERWTYDNGAYFIFEDGLLTTFRK